MSQSKALSSKYNMSTGYIPVVLSTLLCGFIAQDVSVYIGTGIGILGCLYPLVSGGKHIPQLILYATTGMLLLLSVIGLFTDSYCPPDLFPFALEICTLIPSLLLFINRRRLLQRADLYPAEKQTPYVQGAESAIVAARVFLICCTLHFLIILPVLLFDHPLEATTSFVLFRIAPPIVFLAAIAFNQFGIYYFNKVMRNVCYVPIADMEGHVIGKMEAQRAIAQKHEYMNPVIRIAIVVNGMLYLQPRPKDDVQDGGKTDLPLEEYVIYGEKLTDTVVRLMGSTLSDTLVNKTTYHFKYHFESETTNRLIFLFTCKLDDDSLLKTNPRFAGGKLWTLRQIEHNLHRNYLGSCLEHEFDQLKSIMASGSDKPSTEIRNH